MIVLEQYPNTWRCAVVGLMSAAIGEALAAIPGLLVWLLLETGAVWIGFAAAIFAGHVALFVPWIAKTRTEERRNRAE